MVSPQSNFDFKDKMSFWTTPKNLIFKLRDKKYLNAARLCKMLDQLSFKHPVDQNIDTANGNVCPSFQNFENCKKGENLK